MLTGLPVARPRAYRRPMAGRDLRDRWNAGRLAFSTLSGVDKAIVVTTVAAGAIALAQLLSDLRGMIDGVRQLAAGGAIGAFVQGNGLFLASALLAGVLWIVVGRHTKKTAIEAYVEIDLAKGPERERVLAEIAEQAARCHARVDRFGEWAGWTEPATNAALRAAHETDVPLQAEPRKWLAYRDAFGGDTGKALRLFVIRRAIARGSFIFNDDKVRLETSLAKEGVLQPIVTVRRTDYVSSMMTDGIAFRRIQEAPPSSVVLTDGVDGFAVRGHDRKFVLCPLERTRSSNQIGVSVLAFTRDGHALTVLQSGRAGHSQNLLAPSGSGSLDWADLGDPPGGGLLAAARAGALREMREECGLDRGAAHIGAHAMVYAFARLLHRGGKPEFFAIGRIDATLAELGGAKVSRFERIFTNGRQSLFGIPLDESVPLREELRRFCAHFFATDMFEARPELANQQAARSYQLQHGMLLLQEAIEDDASWPAMERFLRR